MRFGEKWPKRELRAADGKGQSGSYGPEAAETFPIGADGGGLETEIQRSPISVY